MPAALCFSTTTAGLTPDATTAVLDHGCRLETRAHGDGSIRYDWHRIYAEVLEAGLK
jgi:hypothetical protein